MKKINSGITLMEIMIVVFLLCLVMGSIMKVLRMGTHTALQGMVQIETVMEAQRVLEQIRQDLKASCFATNDSVAQEVSFFSILSESGTAPFFNYSFLSFPNKGSLNGIIPESIGGTGLSHRRASRVCYVLKPSPPPNQTSSMQLIRYEKLNPQNPNSANFPNGVQTQILSERVRFLEIRPFSLPPEANEQWLYQVTLQLVGSFQRDPKSLGQAGQAFSHGEKGLIIADFYDVVSPDFFTSIWNNEGKNRNWHSGIADVAFSPP